MLAGVLKGQSFRDSLVQCFVPSASWGRPQFFLFQPVRDNSLFKMLRNMPPQTET